VTGSEERDEREGSVSGSLYDTNDDLERSINNPMAVNDWA
jgi:hypothetical protein